MINLIIKIANAFGFLVFTPKQYYANLLISFREGYHAGYEIKTEEIINENNGVELIHKDIEKKIYTGMN